MPQLALLLGVLAAMVLSVSVPVKGAEVIERVVAVVDEEVILLSDLRRLAMPFLGQTLAGATTKVEKKERIQELYKRLLDQLVKIGHNSASLTLVKDSQIAA